MANYNLTQTGNEVQAYIDSIPVIDVTGTLSGSIITFGSNPYSQIAANYAADCSSIIRLTVGTSVYLLRVTQYDGTNYTAAEMSGAHNVVATIGSASASATIDAGIDATPTQGSDNLVKSGGVWSMQNTFVSPTWTNLSIRCFSGSTWSAVVSHYSTAIQVNKGQIVHIESHATRGNYYLWTTDINKVAGDAVDFLQGYAQVYFISANKSAFIEVPEDCYLVIMNESAGGANGKYRSIEVSISNWDTPINNIKNSLANITIPQKEDFTNNKRLTSTGAITDRTGYGDKATLDYFFYPKGTTINFSAYQYDQLSQLCIYNKNKSLLAHIVGGGTTVWKTATYTFTEDGYARFGCYNTARNFQYTFDVQTENIAPRTQQLEKNVAELQGEIADYINTEETFIKEQLNKHVLKNIAVIGFNTDQHLSYGNEVQYAPIIRGLNSLKRISNNIPFDLIVLGGDESGYSTGDTTLSHVSSDIRKVIDAVATDRCPVIAMAGNHDAYQNVGAANSSGDFMYNEKTKRNVVKKELLKWGVASTNSYYDDDGKKIRYIFLDNWSLKNGSSLGSYGADGDTELVHIIEDGLGDAKLVNSDWKVLIISHQVIPSGMGTANCMGDAFWNKIVGYINNGVNVKFAIAGHAHQIVQGKKNGVANIVCGQALPVYSGTSSIGTSFDGIIYYNYRGSRTETGFDVFVWDIDNDKLYDYRYGAGCDRVFNLASGDILLDALSGVVSSSIYTIEGGSIVAKSHNTEYSVALGSTGAYSFPYLCPEMEWTIEVTTFDGEVRTQTYTSVAGAHTLDITIS